jgi:hypothetical protein
MLARGLGERRTDRDATSLAIKALDNENNKYRQSCFLGAR